MFTEGKRKATEDPESPSAAKRVKVDASAEPEPAGITPKVPAIPFPDKVGHIPPPPVTLLDVHEANLTFSSARRDRGAQWRDRIQSRQQ